MVTLLTAKWPNNVLYLLSIIEESMWLSENDKKKMSKLDKYKLDQVVFQDIFDFCNL